MEHWGLPLRAGVSSLLDHGNNRLEDLKSSSPVSMPPTDEQIQRAGGFQAPSSTSTNELSTVSNGGIMSSSNPSEDSKSERPYFRFVEARLAITPQSKRFFVPTVSDEECDRSGQGRQLGDIFGEPSPLIQDNQEKPSNKINERLRHQDNEWVTEVSWTEQDILQAAELERQADAAYISQMASLRTSDWVRCTGDVRSILTPPGQIHLLEADEGEDGHHGGFSGFSASQEASSDKETWRGDGDTEEDDPFETPPSKWFLPPQATFVLPLTRPLVPPSSGARKARRRDQQRSPCAYRGRSSTNQLFHALQYELSMNEEPRRRNVHEPEAESEHLARLFEKDVDSPANYIAGVLQTSDLDAIISNFDVTANEILDDVRAANERFFDHAKDLVRELNYG